MARPILTRFIDKIKRNRQELSRYFVFGVLTTVVNILVFQMLNNATNNYMAANLVAIITAKIFAYFTNKYFVYSNKTHYALDTFKEFIRFVFARGFTGIVDYFGLIILVEWLTMDALYGKYIMQVIVIVLNYILGKKFVFVKK